MRKQQLRIESGGAVARVSRTESGCAEIGLYAGRVASNTSVSAAAING